VKDDYPRQDAGLLFMCFQASIDKQFAYIQRRANQCHDPIIRQLPKNFQELVELDWPVRWGQGTEKATLEGPWITLKGGEFFFTPSIPFLAELGNRQRRQND
jgi:deferrochelatase/peroxidase EfeB